MEVYPSSHGVRRRQRDDAVADTGRPAEVAVDVHLDPGAYFPRFARSLLRWALQIAQKSLKAGGRANAFRAHSRHVLAGRRHRIRALAHLPWRVVRGGRGRRPRRAHGGLQEPRDLDLQSAARVDREQPRRRIPCGRRAPADVSGAHVHSRQSVAHSARGARCAAGRPGRRLRGQLTGMGHRILGHACQRRRRHRDEQLLERTGDTGRSAADDAVS